MDLRSLAVQRHHATVFFVLNISIIWATLAFTFGLAYHLLYLFAVAILWLQYPFFRKARSFGRRLLIFYASFLLFSWSFTLASAPSEAGQLTSLAAVAGLLLRGFAFVMFAHTLGFFLLTLPIAAVNHLLFLPSKTESHSDRLSGDA